ncbi:MAG TPA: response regulator [Steroidobacteraceae bacterium]|nr:response regulator [Steroidobacteraceae bacterium]
MNSSILSQQQLRERPLQGRRVLVVEDDYFIALELCTALRSAGAEVLGPARDVESGLAAIGEQRLDCAVLDINLRGRMAFPIAAELRKRGVPTIFATGYDETMVPAEHAATLRLEKPVNLPVLCRAVEECCTGEPPA